MSSAGRRNHASSDEGICKNWSARGSDRRGLPQPLVLVDRVDTAVKKTPPTYLHYSILWAIVITNQLLPILCKCVRILIDVTMVLVAPPELCTYIVLYILCILQAVLWRGESFGPTSVAFLAILNVTLLRYAQELKSQSEFV